MKDRDNIILNIYFALVNSEFPPLQYPPKSGPLFSQSPCAFEHIFICFSYADGNLGRKVATPLHVLPLACCQVSTTFFINPAFSLGFSGHGCAVTSERALLHHLLDSLRNENRLMIYRKQPNSCTELNATFYWMFKKMYSLEAAGNSFPGSEI